MQLRVRIRNHSSMEESLPKLRRSLKAQSSIELGDEESQGVFLLLIKNTVNMNELLGVRRLLDAYGFEFYYPTVDADEIYGCQCDECRAARAARAAARQRRKG